MHVPFQFNSLSFPAFLEVDGAFFYICVDSDLVYRTLEGFDRYGMR